jgi:glycerophosphoryl diester phosphodiesterase
MIDPTLWPPPVVIAHRGSRQLWPENTMHAFEQALETGVEHIETDVHVSSDGVVHCLHDHNIDRTTDGNGLLSQYSAKELERFDAGFRHAPGAGYPFRGLGIRVPRFEDVVAALPEVKFVVELKEDAVVEPLASLIGRTGIGQRLVVGSFSDARLARFRELTGAEVPVSTGVAATRRWLASSRVGRHPATGASALQVPLQMRGLRVVSPRLVSIAHAAGLQVHVWTVNDPQVMSQLLVIGVDGLITDRPDVALEVVADHSSSIRD